MRQLLAFAAVLSAASAAWAGDLKVGKGAPFPTIQSAVDAAADGDRILVGRGVYRENVTFKALSNVQFIGKGAVWDGTLGPGQSGPCLFGSGNGILVQGFKFRHGEGHVVLSGSGNRIAKCVSRNSRNTALDLTGDGGHVEGCQVVGSSSGAIHVAGANAVISKNKVRNCDDYGIHVQGNTALAQGNDVRNVQAEGGLYVTGDDAQVVSNTIVNTAYESIRIDGLRAKVLGNTCSFTASAAGIYVYGNSMEVGSNRVTASSDHGLALYGDSVSVHDNVVSVTIDSGVGIMLDENGAGGGTLERNTVTDSASWGFVLGSTGLIVRQNTARGCGTADSGGFRFAGGGMTIERCVADACRRTGFHVGGDANKVTDSTATNCTGDGFRVYGQSPRLTRLKATGSGGEGLDNRGVQAVVETCTFTGNRLDVACDVANGASIPGGLAGTKYVTGGVTQAPQVDN